MKERISLDYTFMREEGIGKNGIKDLEIEEVFEKLKRAKKELTLNKKSCLFEFSCLPYTLKNLQIIKDKVSSLKERYKTMAVFGIGGSDLGTRALYEFLDLNGSFKLKFFGDTTDPYDIERFMKEIRIKETCFNFVSRSGETIEILAPFGFLKGKLNKEQVVVTTGEAGYLRDEAQKEGYFLFEEPKGVPDRFSVLSVVGLLPMLFAGADIEKILDGAIYLSNLIDETSVREDPMLIYAGLLYLAYAKHKQCIGLFMPYSKRLSAFGRWVRQIFAESLGKSGLGITPLDLMGPTDQHSFLQLILDGPADKVTTFFKVEDRGADFKIPDFKGFKDLTFGSILNAEYEATSATLAKKGRPNMTINIPSLNEYFVGQLFYFFEIAVSYLGMLFEVNPFDQPAVEENKKLIHSLLTQGNKEKGKKFVI
ncbi:hypothetical protein A2716_04175 [candidate division WWE3 bacterium RIFCSPHIGHO2_01_FULL_40_23]|uniref:Glucose-6-phosphate isomerase n=1 Tax=candidate division WWE3 bacterium RIFCSPLOWO2_01_FULL_41_18 TaxID=1802625 RepID=A0A1F4VCU0_UNCKA|nr:MAG: hypothetical protein A2716_04175 [candidate division WWE3 bacterium RIFCSPHIGHO2_01_FULL_40_23]OGC55071.1 MAG: hypothetical protein A3A78_03785 [candidate division WWE3 bacterium RIFCSPLOWO2_01_FULL_41_18]